MIKTLFLSLHLFLSFPMQTPVSAMQQVEHVQLWGASTLAVPQAPYLAGFKHSALHPQKELVYVAALHAGAHNPSFALIDQAFASLEPEVVIIEGVPSNLGENHPAIIEQVQEMPAGHGQEAYYAAAHALRSGIPFSGGEPNPRWVLDQLVERYQHTVRDVWGFDIVRESVVWKRLSHTNFEALFAEYQEQLQRMYAMPSPFSDAEDFRQWYRQRQHLDFDLSLMPTSLAAPDCGAQAQFTQTLSCQTMFLRDEHLLQHILHQLQRYDRVLVVYGAGHFQTQHQALSHYFERPPEFSGHDE